jgi:hypothetical protein
MDRKPPSSREVPLTVAAGAVAAVFVAGLLTDAKATSAGVWISAAPLAWLLSGMFALFGPPWRRRSGPRAP